MEIYEALKKDHELVLGLVRQLVALKSGEEALKHDLIEMIRDELVPHSRAEEAVFYNSMRMLDMSKSLAMNGYQEHMEAEGILRILQVTQNIDVAWKTTALKLQNALEHHIAEEEGEMFEAAQALFTSEEAVVMAEVFEKMKPTIKEEGFAMTTVEMLKNLMPPRLSMVLDNFSFKTATGSGNKPTKSAR